MRLRGLRMRSTVPTPRSRMSIGTVVTLAAALVLSACGVTPKIGPAELPLPKETLSLMGRKGMSPQAPIFVRIFKEESELEIWKARMDGRYYHFKTYPICNWSGELGPKLKEGDKQAPEGFYTVSQEQMNPNSKFHLAFNLGFPNAYDRAHGRTGTALMVHGKCSSAGCYAMTDALAEEIYAIAREAFLGGQTTFQVHALPFRMTDQKLARFKGHKWYRFWRRLKVGYDYFELNRVPPPVSVCEHRYHVGMVSMANYYVNPRGRCPRFERPTIDPFFAQPAEWQLASERVTVSGPKKRNAKEVARSTAVAASEHAARSAPLYRDTLPGISALGYAP